MGYALGVDVGTSKTAAAVFAGDRVDVVELGNRSAVVPSVVFRTGSGDLLFGEAADRRGNEEPERVAREFKRRVGDTVPLLVGGTPMAAQRLMALTVRWVIGRVSELRGGPPGLIVVACPANWGPYKRTAIENALAALDIDAALATEPECAAAQVSGLDDVPVGGLVAGYDLGGGTFDAAVMRRGPRGFRVVGAPLGIESIGGADVDAAVFAHLWHTLGEDVRATVADSPAADLAALRRDVVGAKEHLSEDTQARILVHVDGERRQVLLQRSELEERVRPLVDETVECLRRTVARAGAAPGDLAAVLLVGGASRMPIVAERVGAGLGVPVIRDSRPHLSVALGAAVLTQRPPEPTAAPAPIPAQATRTPSEPAIAPAPPPTTMSAAEPAAEPATMSATESIDTPVAEPATARVDEPVTAPALESDAPDARSNAGPDAGSDTLPRRRRSRRLAAGMSAAVGLMVAGGIAVAGVGGDGERRETGGLATGTPSHDSSATTAPPVTRQVTVTVRGTAGLGVIRSLPEGIECASEATGCTFAFPAGTVVLRAVPRDGDVRFRGWDGACEGTADCRLTLTGAGTPLAVRATFAERVRASADTPYEPEPEQTLEPTDVFTDPPQPTDTEGPDPDPEPTRPPPSSDPTPTDGPGD